MLIGAFVCECGKFLFSFYGNLLFMCLNRKNDLENNVSLVFKQNGN